MSDIDVGAAVGSGGILAVIVKLAYDYWRSSRAGNSQADANTALYELLRKEIREMHIDIDAIRKRERKLEKILIRVTKQIALLEQLCEAAGIDVQQAYKDRGIDPSDGDDDE